MVVPFSVQVAGVVTSAVQSTFAVVVTSQRSHLMVATAVLPSGANAKVTWALSVLLKSWSVFFGYTCALSAVLLPAFATQ